MNNSKAKNMRIAQLLLNEIKLYMKSAKANKVATNLDSADKIKEEWAYWACASLLQLQEDGVESLQNYMIPKPKTETARQYGTKVLRSVESEGGNLSQLLESLWISGGKANLKAMSSTVDEKFTYWYDGDAYIELKRKKDGITLRPSTKSDSIAYAETWAFRLNGHVGWDKTRTKTQPSSKTRPWNRIQENTKKGSDDTEGLVKSVSKAIEVGVYRYILSGTKWRSSLTNVTRPMVQLDSEDSYGRSRQETTSGGGSSNPSSSSAYNPEYAVSQSDEEYRIQQIIDGVDFQEAVEELMEDADESDPNSNALYSAYVNGRFDDFNAVKGKVRQVLSDYDLILSDDQIEQVKAYIAENGSEVEDLIPAVQGILARIEDEAWIEENVSITSNPTTAAEELTKLADQVIQGSVPQHKSSSETAQAIMEAETASQELSASILWCESVLEKFQSGDYHWLYDNHLYIDREWYQFVSSFNSDAMVKMDRLIKQQQNPLIASAFGLLVNRSSLMSVPRLKSIKKFVDDCMDQAVVKAEINQPSVLSWYLTLSVSIDPLTVQTTNGPLKIANINMSKDGFNPIPWTGKVSYGMFGLICEALRTQTPAQTNAMKKAMQERLDDIVPEAGGLLGKFGKLFDKWVSISDKLLDKKPPRKLTDEEKEGMTEAEISKVEKKFFRSTNAYDGRQLFNQTRGTMGKTGKAMVQANGWFGVIVSELVRYRFYLDLGYDNIEINDPLVPTGMGNDACDNNVRSLIGPTPAENIERAKRSSLEHGAESWAEDFAESLKGLVKIKVNNLKKINKEQDKLMREIGLQDYDELYDLYVEKKGK